MLRTASIAAMLLAAGCAQSPAPEPFPQDRVAAWIEAYQKDDAPGVAALYTEDAQLLPPDREIISGRAAIEEFIRQGNPPGGPPLEVATIETQVFGDYAYRQGSFRMKNADGSVAGSGKSIELWRKVGGEWLIHREIWSWNAPETEPPDMTGPAP